MRIIEITIAAAIGALAATYAVPTFTISHAKQESLFAISRIKQAVQLAKTLATPNQHIYICASNNKQTCSKYPAKYCVLINKTNQTVVLSYPALKYGLIQFKPNDKRNNILSITSNITSTPGRFIYIPHRHKHLQKTLVINNNGRVYKDH